MSVISISPFVWHEREEGYFIEIVNRTFSHQFCLQYHNYDQILWRLYTRVHVCKHVWPAWNSWVLHGKGNHYVIAKHKESDELWIECFISHHEWISLGGERSLISFKLKSYFYGIYQLQMCCAYHELIQKCAPSVTACATTQQQCVIKQRCHQNTSNLLCKYYLNICNRMTIILPLHNPSAYGLNMSRSATTHSNT